MHALHGSDGGPRRHGRDRWTIASPRPCCTWSRERTSRGRTGTTSSHNVVGVGGAWGIPDLTLHKGDTVSYRFDEDGVYPVRVLDPPGHGRGDRRRRRRRDRRGWPWRRRPEATPPPQKRVVRALVQDGGNDHRHLDRRRGAGGGWRWPGRSRWRCGTGGRRPSPARPSGRGSSRRPARSCPPAAAPA